MKQKRMEYLINRSGVLGFDFENSELSVNWSVTPGAGKMLARRTIENDYATLDVHYEAVPYSDINAVDVLYEDIVIDFVEFYQEDLHNGTGVDWNLFDDIASAQDEGLLELLSFFGKTYGEFLNDVFYWFSAMEELDQMIESADIPEFDEEDSADDHLVRKVLEHLGDHWLYVAYNLRDEGYYWNFAKARGKIWFSRSELEFYDFGYFVDGPVYGCVDMDDEDAMGALRDAVLTDFTHDGWEMEESGEALELLGIHGYEL